MKKSELNSANFAGAEVLTKAQMKMITGGTQFSCQCNGVGTWTGNYSSAQQIANDINAYCRNGGTCTAVNTPPPPAP